MSFEVGTKFSDKNYTHNTLSRADIVAGSAKNSVFLGTCPEMFFFSRKYLDSGVDFWWKMTKKLFFLILFYNSRYVFKQHFWDISDLLNPSKPRFRMFLRQDRLGRFDHLGMFFYPPQIFILSTFFGLFSKVTKICHSNVLYRYPRVIWCPWTHF